VGAFGEKPPQEKPGHKKVKPNTVIGRRKGGTPVGYSGRTALRREQCDIQAFLEMNWQILFRGDTILGHKPSLGVKQTCPWI
jgi:hypothetical protein